MSWSRGVVVVLAMVAACGGSAKPTSGSAGDAGDAVEGPPDKPACPATVPDDASPCPADSSLRCDYVENPSTPWCRTRAQCQGSRWMVIKPADACGLRARECPETFASLPDGAECPAGFTMGVSCDYDEGRCGCVPCNPITFSQKNVVWSCRRWDSGGPGCPASPRLGTTCATPGMTCLYAECASVGVGDNVLCVDGSWVLAIPSGGNCGMHECAH